ncbi:MAG: phosphopantothenate--cysteine ligase [Defluviitaleaceae bacterium]|nr:phosphopantothenate--cysteine ligase [Defluviitaleaceae bacterium]
MNVLVTAGGTSEAIDSIRSITNYSTGRLGSTIADVFASNNAAVTYVYGTGANMPSSKNINPIPIVNVQELTSTIEGLLENHKYDCIIHSMAVSDFTPQAYMTLDDIVANIAAAISTQPQQELASTIKQAILASRQPLSQGKISSQTQNLMLCLQPTTKVIKLIKSKQPETILVGFKLLSSATEGQLQQAASEVLTQNSCDFVLANDLKNINSHTHKAILYGKGGPIYSATTKQEIAEIIYKSVTGVAQARPQLR